MCENASEPSGRGLVECSLPGAKAHEQGATPFGRPTAYRPEMCQVVVDLGRLGYSKAMIAAHPEIDVSRNTLDNWGEEYPDFLSAMLRARELALAWWESQGQLGVWGQGFNANAYRLQVTNRFPAEWKDKQTQEHQNPDGSALALTVNFVTPAKIE